MNKKLTDNNKNMLLENKRIDNLYERVAPIIREARITVIRTIDAAMVFAYWKIGKKIIEEEQQGDKRASYGKGVLKQLSIRLSKEFGRGFGITTLEDIRKFYLIYQDIHEKEKPHAARGVLAEPTFNSALSWTHYRLLMRVARVEARKFYEIEASKNRWSSRELERQINSLLFDRLAKSKDKEGLLKLSQDGQELVSPVDVIKDPVVLEFLGLPESHRFVESEVEEALINNLQSFLLELGKGFAFVARQKRLTLDGDYFYADLVFYHVILKCYVVIDIKTRKLSHADLGQMLLYVNYFDQEIKAEDDNPTVGLILCTEKNTSTVKYTLGEKSKQVFASKYQFHLPTEKELEEEISREVNEIKYKLSKEL